MISMNQAAIIEAAHLPNKVRPRFVEWQVDSWMGECRVVKWLSLGRAGVVESVEHVPGLTVWNGDSTIDPGFEPFFLKKGSYHFTHLSNINFSF